MSTYAASCLSLIVLAGTLIAQPLALTCTVTPNVAAPGTSINFALESSSLVSLTTGCGINEIRAGSPTGPIVWQPFICPLILLFVAPGATLNRTWNQLGSNGLQVPAGDYFVRFNYWDQTSTLLTSRFFPFRIEDPLAPIGPTLSTLGDPTTGNLWSLQISDPPNPGAIYYMACSLTTDVGWTVNPNLHVALDQDALWNLTYPTADPSIFLSFAGALDGSGLTTSPAVLVPSVPALVGLPLSVQGLVLNGAGAALTNAISKRIR